MTVIDVLRRRQFLPRRYPAGNTRPEGHRLNQTLTRAEQQSLVRERQAALIENGSWPEKGYPQYLELARGAK